MSSGARNLNGGSVVAGDGKSRQFIMAGLTLGLLLASLDQTVVGTSLPKIVGDLGGLDRFSWLFSAYMLAATIMIPMAGKMSDRYGRRPVFLLGMVFFLSGSALSGLAQDMNQLIIFRFFQGFGGGAMFPVAVATVADLYAPSERGKMQGALGAVFALASIIGPFVGGWIVDNIDWRWVFYVNLPFGAAAIVVTSVKFPRVDVDAREPVDYLGIALLTAALSAGLLITFWGGTTYDWASIEILSLGAACVLLSVAFIYVETTAPDPMLPLSLFREPVFALSSLSLMVMVMGLLGIVAFLPLFLQAVIGISATYSGELLVPLMLTSMLGAIVSGLMLKKTGYKIWILGGPLITALGLYLLSTLHSGSDTLEAVAYLLIAGLGLGFTMANYVVAGQNVVSKEMMGVASSTLTLFRTLGGTIGVTVLGVVVNRRFSAELSGNMPTGWEGLESQDMSTLGNLLLSAEGAAFPPEVIEGIRTALSESITFTFLVSAFVVLGAFAVTTLIKNVPLKSREEQEDERRSAGIPDMADGGIHE
ncbi:MAG: MFS transporter [Candidatus Thermoplasmatota archaeon]|nr:MFS transporter [Candidatus Thermoplasmatota archaeon]